ncbi:MAG: class I SAM-dependent methyltransferase [Pseudomonadota bacterium]
MANQDQIDFWNGEAGERWTEHADALDQMLSPFIPAVLSAARLKPGEQVLDVGCGAGALTMAAAAATGAAHGVDVSKPLIGLARKRADESASPARFDIADASAWRPEAPMDVLVSRFGVMFFDEPVAAFQNLAQAIAPGGRLAFACWRSLAENEWVSVPLGAILPMLPEPPAPPPPGAPGPFAFGDRVRVEDILDEAGWTNIVVEPWDGAIAPPGRTVAETARFMLEIGPLGRLIAEAELETDPVLARVAEVLEGMAGGDGDVAMNGAAWIVQASRP